MRQSCVVISKRRGHQVPLRTRFGGIDHNPIHSSDLLRLILRDGKHVHAALCKSFLIRGARVDFGLLQCVPSENAHELMRRRAVLGRDRRTSFAQPMRTTRHLRFNATITEPLAESRVRERTTEFVHQKGHIAARRSVDDPLQCWQQRQD
jgi:hypothetical protein